jgi:hypothetical protein
MESKTFGVNVKTHETEPRNYVKTDDTMKDGSIGEDNHQECLLLLFDVHFLIDLNPR